MLLLALACNGPEPVGDDTSSTHVPQEWILNAQQGAVPLSSVQSIEWGLDGYLIIGDGVGGTISAVATGDVDTSVAADMDALGDLDLHAIVGGTLGVDPGDVLISDVSVNPHTHRLALAVREYANGTWSVVTVNADGTGSVLDLSDVAYAQVAYPEIYGNQSAVVDVTIAGDHVVASAMASTWNPSVVLAVPWPLEHDASAGVASTRSYHRTHKEWETNAPVNRLFAFEHDGAWWIGASYQCAPVVRFRVSDVLSQDEVVGETPFDYGGGKQVEDFLPVDTPDGKRLMAAISSFAGGDAMVLADWDLLTQDVDLDEAAPIVLNVTSEPRDAGVTVLDVALGDQLALRGDDVLVYYAETGMLETIAVP